MKCPSRALLLHDLCRLQLQSPLLWLTFYSDVLAVNTLLLARCASLACSKLGREQVRVENPTFDQVFDGHLLQTVKNTLDDEGMEFQIVCNLQRDQRRHSWADPFGN